MRALQSFGNLCLPDGWRLCRFDEVFELVYGCALPETQRTGNGFPVFGSNGIVGHHTPPTVNSAGIIVGRKGTAGAVTWSETPFTPIDTTYFVRLKNSDYSMRWAYHLLDLTNLPRLAAATGVPGLTRSDPQKLLIPVPPCAEQQAIGAILQLADQQITAIEKTTDAAKRLQRALMRELFSGRVRADGTVRSEGDFTPHSKLGLIPRKWQAAKGSALFKLHGAYFADSLAFSSEPERADCLFMKVEDFNHPLNAARIVRTSISLHLGDQARKFRPCKSGWLVIAKRGAAILHNRVRILTCDTLLDPNLMAIEMLEDHSSEYFRYLLTHMNLSRFL